MSVATALHQVIRLAIQSNIQRLYIEGENLMVINAIQGLESYPW